MDDETVERVRALVRAIPAGSTSTYGEVAALAGLSTPRLVGRILAEDGHDLPWHRVLRADGTCAPHIAVEQAARLRAEGVLLVDGRLPRPRRRRPTPTAEDRAADGSRPGGRGREDAAGRTRPGGRGRGGQAVRAAAASASV